MKERQNIGKGRLMVGDWVYSPWSEGHGIPVRVDSLLGSGATAWRVGEESGLASKVYPVPLTPEIFEKNGFVDESTDTIGVWSLFHIDEEEPLKRWSVTVSFYTRWIIIVHNEMENRHYTGAAGAVHELQQAMRICGIPKDIVL